MSILYDIMHHVFGEDYPLVRSIINDVRGINDEVVARVEKRVLAAAKQIEEKAEELEENADPIEERFEERLHEFEAHVTVEILDARASQRELQEKTSYDWRHSPVDLLKLVNIDSSFSNRQALARFFRMPEYSGTEAQGEELLKRIKKWLWLGET